MQILIDIPDEWEKRIESNQRPDSMECADLVKSIWNGKILSKGHESLMDKHKNELIYKLSTMPHMVIGTAYLYAINYTSYGEDVTEKWVTATQQTSALEKAYRKGYYDALQRKTESEAEE